MTRAPSTSHATNGSAGSGDAPAGNGASDLRVILVGRTGLDATLRRDAKIELIRARTGLEAIGELADPIDATSPGSAVVVVGEGAIPGELAGPEMTEPGLIAALRLVNRDAMIVGMSDAASGAARSADSAMSAVSGTPTVSSTFDAVLPSDASAAAFWRMFEEARQRRAQGAAHASAPAVHAARAPTVAPASAPAPANTPRVAEPAVSTTHAFAPTPASPMPVAPVAPAATAASVLHTPPPAALVTADDTRLVHALLTGRDLLAPALDLVRQRTGAADVLYVPVAPAVPSIAPASASSSAASALADPAGAPVRHRDRLFGVLTSRACGPDALRLWGDWLGQWLALADQQAELRRSALVDDLTGAWNRRYFERFLRASLVQAAASRHWLSLMLFDIDDFKRFNDRYGHAAGDEILKAVVSLLTSGIRSCDRVCRIGGDEFAVVFYEPAGPRDPASRPPTTVETMAARFRRQVAEQRFPALGENAPGCLSISGGLATYPWDGHTAEELIAAADTLAMESKRSGKNAITLGPGAKRVCGEPE